MLKRFEGMPNEIQSIDISFVGNGQAVCDKIDKIISELEKSKSLILSKEKVYLSIDNAEEAISIFEMLPESDEDYSARLQSQLSKTIEAIRTHTEYSSQIKTALNTLKKG